jgi:Transcriptional Coactivator p15 (PC4)
VYCAPRDEGGGYGRHGADHHRQERDGAVAERGALVRGYAFVDMRVYFQDDAGVWQPTRKGITVSLDLWIDFKAAIVGLAVDEVSSHSRGSQ